MLIATHHRLPTPHVITVHDTVTRRGTWIRARRDETLVAEIRERQHEAHRYEGLDDLLGHRQPFGTLTWD